MMDDVADIHHQPVKVFDINVFNRRIMKMSAEGSLSEEWLRPQGTFISSKRLSEGYQLGYVSNE